MRNAGILGASLLVALATACGGGGGDNGSDKCGDGNVTGAEECDDGNTVGGDGCSSTCHTETSQGVCGDGVVDVATETCDDHNTTNGDGCDSTCHTETSSPVCGDGVVATGEGCDDGAKVAGDGCSATCTVESGYMCTGMPSTCTHTSTTGGTCAAPLNLALTGTLTQTGTITGDTTNSTDQVNGDCDGFTADGMGTNDQIVKFTTTDVRDVTVVLTPSANFDGIVRLSSAACMLSTEIQDDAQDGDGCSDFGAKGEDEELDYSALPAGTYYVTVDGFHGMTSGPSMGPWSLTVTANKNNCGDGVVDANETCDDGAKVDGDGCSAACTVEPGYSCTGMPSTCTQSTTATCAMPNAVTLAAGTGTDLVATGMGDTSNAANLWPSGACGPFTSGGGSDQVWSITTTDTRDLFISLDATSVIDGSIRLVTTCDPTMVATKTVADNQAVGCSDFFFNGHTEQLSYASLPAGTYFLVVDNFDSSTTGAYSFHVRAAVPGCGNGIVGTGEGCDDGNMVGGDHCSATCALESDVTETEPNDTAAQANVLTAGSHSIKGTYSATDTDLYTFTLTQTSTLEIEAYHNVDATWVYDGVGTHTMFSCGLQDDSYLALFDSTGDPTDDSTAIAGDLDDGALLCPYVGALDSDGPDPTELVDLPAGTYTLKIAADSNAPTDPSGYVIDFKVTPSGTTMTPVAPAAGDLVINEYLADDATADSNCDGVTTGTDDEFVELVNKSAKTLDLTGVTLWDSTTAGGPRFTFAAAASGSLTLAPGKAVVVWGGGAPACPGVTDWFITASNLGLNNQSSGGDSIIVKSADATPFVITQLSYTTATTMISSNLNPDVTGTTYANHDTITGHVGSFSPGKKSDGTAF